MIIGEIVNTSAVAAATTANLNGSTVVKRAIFSSVVLLSAAVLQSCESPENAPTQSEAITALPPGYENMTNFSCGTPDYALVYRCKFEFSGQQTEKPFRKIDGKWAAILDPS